MIVADAVLDEVVQHLLHQRRTAGDAGAFAFDPHFHSLLRGEAGEPPRHAFGHGTHVDGRGGFGVVGRLVQT